MVNDTIKEKEDRERRRYLRVFYSAEDRMIGVFVVPGKKQKVLEARIMNVSMGGLHFTVDRNGTVPLKIGDRLTLKRLIGNSPLRISSDIEVEIKWILDLRSMKRVGFGCEFQELPEMIQYQLSGLIESGQKPL